MAWQDEAVLLLRNLIDDVGESPTYSDGRLEELLVSSAYMVNMELDLGTTYTITISEVSISPDPVDQSDSAFVNLMVLKAACMTDQAIFRTKALAAGIEAKCGPAVLKTVQHLSGFKELLEQGPCAAYKELKRQYKFGNLATCRAILSPFVSNDFDPRNLTNHHHPYGEY